MRENGGRILFQINNRAPAALVISCSLAMSVGTQFTKSFYAKFFGIVFNGNHKFNHQRGFDKDLFKVTLTWKDLERSELERVQLKCLQIYQEEYAALGKLRKIEMDQQSVAFYADVSDLMFNKMQKC